MHNITIDYLGLWNEKSYNSAWTIALRKALDQADLEHVLLVAADDGETSICSSFTHISWV